MRISKGLKNSLMGFLSQFITIGVGIIIPRLVLVNLGSEANGLLNSIGNVLSYLSLLEAGVGMASLQVLYRPAAEANHKRVNEIMAATDYYYKRSGMWYAIIILIISVVYSLYVKTSFPRSIVFSVVVLAGVPSIINYLFQGKLRILLMAEGKNYVITIITTIFSVLSSVLKAGLLVSGVGIIGVQILHFSLALAQMIVYEIYFKKYYPWLDIKVQPDLHAISQRNAVLVHQLSDFVFNHVDVLLLTIFTDLKVVSVYSMYIMIYGMVKYVAVTFSDGYLYTLGQNLNNKEKFIKIFDIYEVVNMSMTFAVFCIGYNLMLPFLSIYTRGVIDINYVDPKINYLMVSFYLLQNARKSSLTMIQISQKFEETKWWALAEVAVNIVSSVILVYFWGIYGVLAGSLIALLFRSFEIITYASRLLDRIPWITGLRWITCVGLFISLSALISKINISSSNYASLIIKGVVYSIIILFAYLLSIAVLYRKQFLDIIMLVKARRR